MKTYLNYCYCLICCFILDFTIISNNTAFAQMYFDDGKVICCGNAIATTTDASIINPANLGMVEKKANSFGLMQFSFNSFSNTLPKKEIFKSMFSQQAISDNAQEAIDNNAENGEPFKLNGDVQMNWISGSWANPKYGGFALQLSDKITGRFNLQPDLTQTLLVPDNLNTADVPNDMFYPDAATETAPSQLFYTHTRHASMSYGRSALETDAVKVYAGFNFTYLWGIGHFSANIADSLATGNSSFSNLYNINYGSLDSILGSFTKDLFSSAGKGYSVSIGAKVAINQKLHAGIAVLNLSRLTWDKKVLMAQNATLDTTVTGVDSYQFTDEAAQMYQLMGFEAGNRFATQQNGKLRLNADYLLTQKLLLYADWVMPLTEEAKLYQPTSFSAGINAQLVPDNGVNLSSGIFYNTEYGFRVPVGIAFRMGKKMFLSVATADLRTLVSKRNANPSLSVSLYRISL